MDTQMDKVGLLQQGSAAIVTGAASGIGKATALALASCGVKLTLLDLDTIQGSELERQIVSNGGRAQFVACDVTNSDAQRAAFAKHMEAYGALDVCILNAGVGFASPDFRALLAEGQASSSSHVGEADWRRMSAINLGAVVEGAALAVSNMRARGGVVLVNASSAGILPAPGLEAYAATKAGAVHFVRSLAWMHQAANIRVCCVCPQFTDTPLVQSMGKHLAQQIQSWKMPRVLRVEEVVGAIMELLADDGEGGGAVLAVTAQAGRTYWRRQKSGRQQKSGAPRRPPPSPELAAWATLGMSGHDGGVTRKLVATKLSPDFRAATAIVEGVSRTASLAPGQVLIRRALTGVNASDINFTSGRYHGPGAQDLLPLDVGFESVGVVAAVGAHAAQKLGVAVGSPVATMSYGGFSEYAVEEFKNVVPVPAVSRETVALLTSGLTASIALEQSGRMRGGETVLVTAAAGGTGQFAVQLAKLAGNHVIATCGSDQKADLLRQLGAHRVVNYRKESLKQVLKSEYKAGVDLVYESVGGDMFNTALNALAYKGRLVVIGMMSQYTSGKDGGWAVLSHPGLPEKLLNKSATVTGEVPCG